MQIVMPAQEGEMSQAKNTSEKDPKVDEQLSMKMALAKSHLFLGYITVRTGLGEAEQWAITRN